jgi:very-long-chain (3R)-3-hydroxyacyl-CoA dehydratase
VRKVCREKKVNQRSFGKRAVSDIVRYAYYIWNAIVPGKTPYALTWLRYTLFYILYPIGIIGELYIVWEAHTQMEYPLKYLTWMALAAYIPGGPTMYLHMIKQRKKVLGGGSKGVSSKKKAK